MPGARRMRSKLDSVFDGSRRGSQDSENASGLTLDTHRNFKNRSSWRQAFGARAEDTTIGKTSGRPTSCKYSRVKRGSIALITNRTNRAAQGRRRCEQRHQDHCQHCFQIIHFIVPFVDLVPLLTEHDRGECRPRPERAARAVHNPSPRCAPVCSCAASQLP